jgi:hypothetical protein
MNKTRTFIVKAFVCLWAVGLLLIIVGGFIFGLQDEKVSLEWLKTFLSGTTAIITGIIGYYFGAKSKQDE